MALVIKVVEAVFIGERRNSFSASLHAEPASALFDFLLFLANMTRAHSNIRREGKGQNHKFLTSLGEGRHCAQVPVADGSCTSRLRRQC